MRLAARRRRSPTTAAWPAAGDRGRALAALVEAGREATARTAFDEAAGHLRRAVEVAGGAGGGRPGGRCANTVTRCAAPGHGEDARAAFLAGGGRARATGDTALLARAAFGAAPRGDDDRIVACGVIALLEEALAALRRTGPTQAVTRDGCCPRRWRASSPMAPIVICPVPSGSPRRGGRRPGDGTEPQACWPMRCSRWATCAGSRAPRPNGCASPASWPPPRPPPARPSWCSRRTCPGSSRCWSSAIRRSLSSSTPSAGWPNGRDPAVPVPGPLAAGHPRVAHRAAGDGRRAHRPPRPPTASGSASRTRGRCSPASWSAWRSSGTTGPG